MTSTPLWDRKLWGIVFVSNTKNEKPILMGELWWYEAQDKFIAHQYDPTRPLLFTKRHAARAWAKEQNEKYRQRTDLCGKWRFRVVRVRERQEVIE